MAGADEEVIVCDARGFAADATTVDALARLQLLARRQGYRIELGNPSLALCQLLVFAGLADVFALNGRDGRQAEQREHAGRVEEGVDPDDAVA